MDLSIILDRALVPPFLLSEILGQEEVDGLVHGEVHQVALHDRCMTLDLGSEEGELARRGSGVRHLHPPRDSPAPTVGVLAHGHGEFPRLRTDLRLVPPPLRRPARGNSVAVPFPVTIARFQKVNRAGWCPKVVSDSPNAGPRANKKPCLSRAFRW